MFSKLYYSIPNYTAMVSDLLRSAASKLFRSLSAASRLQIRMTVVSGFIAFGLYLLIAFFDYLLHYTPDLFTPWVIEHTFVFFPVSVIVLNVCLTGVISKRFGVTVYDEIDPEPLSPGLSAAIGNARRLGFEVKNTNGTARFTPVTSSFLTVQPRPHLRLVPPPQSDPHHRPFDWQEHPQREPFDWQKDAQLSQDA